MPGEPGALVLTLFDQIVSRIKSTKPLRTDGKELVTGFVYSQLVLGMPVDPRDYRNPWSPMGGSTLQEALATAEAPATAPAPASATPAAPAPASAAPAASAPAVGPDPKFRRAMEAAFKTSQLVDRLLMVTKDDTYLEYPTSRKVSFAYDNIINGMQPGPMPPIAPEVQKQIDEARAVLYEPDEDGDLVIKSKLYKKYLKNARAYAEAKAAYADAQALALSDPAVADTWPQKSVLYQQQVDETWDTFKTEGAERVERALDIIQSVGVSMQARMVAKARKIYDAWNLGLAGVPIPVPYSYVSPTSWCDPDADEDGWQRLRVTHFEYSRHKGSSGNWHSEAHSHSSSSSSGGSGGVFGGFVNIVGGGSSSSSSSSSSNSWNWAAQNSFHNDAKRLTIDLEYALCTINRPWLLGDLFYTQNWYLVNNAQNAISDGSIDNQVQNEKPLLPMIPNQFLVIRNVRISATEWGSDGQTIASMLGSSSTSSSNSGGGGSGGFSIGPIVALGGHSEHEAHSDSQRDGEHEFQSEYQAHWDGQTLTIRGAQIVAWLSEIVPACPPLPDPGLTQPK